MESSKYICNCCNFSTNVKSSYKRHLTTNKHIMQIKKVNREKNKIFNIKYFSDYRESFFKCHMLPFFSNIHYFKFFDLTFGGDVLENQAQELQQIYNDYNKYNIECKIKLNKIYYLKKLKIPHDVINNIIFEFL